MTFPVPDGVKADYLSNNPDFIPAFAQAVHKQWKPILKNEKLEERVEKLRSHLNQDKLPIAWVAYSEDRTIGTAALRANDLEVYENLTPWLGGVFVAPRERQRGIGKALCRIVEDKAFSMGYRKMYLMSIDMVDFYRWQGWVVSDSITWHGYPGFVMEKNIG